MSDDRTIEVNGASPFACGAPQLGEFGFHLLPLKPAEKRPLIKDWTRYATACPSEAELALWSRWRDANIGAAMGSPIGDGTILIAVDIDVDDLDSIDRIKSALPQTPMAKLGKRGETLFFRAPIGTATVVWRRDAKTTIVEFLSEGRQTVLPPSIHPDTGRAYVWASGPVPVVELPLLDEDAFERLREAAEAVGAAPGVLVEENSTTAAYGAPKASALDDDEADPVTVVNRRLNEAALANLDRWAPHLNLPNVRRLSDGRWEATAWWRPSNDGNPIERRKRNLSFHRAGIRDFGADKGYSPTGVVSAALDLSHDDAFRWLDARVRAFPGTYDDELSDPVAMQAMMDRRRERNDNGSERHG